MSTLFSVLERLTQPDEGPPDDLSADDAHHVIAMCREVVERIERSWGAVDQWLDSGIEGRKLLFILQEQLDVVGLCLWMLPRVREKLEAKSPPYEEMSADLLALDSSARRIRVIHDELQSLVTWLKTPPPRIDPTALPRADERERVEGTETLEAILTRLNAGGDI